MAAGVAVFGRKIFRPYTLSKQWMFFLLGLGMYFYYLFKLL